MIYLNKLLSACCLFIGLVGCDIKSGNAHDPHLICIYEDKAFSPGAVFNSKICSTKYKHYKYRDTDYSNPEDIQHF